ncbi:MAG: nucleotidyltransferase family protein [Bacteroidota bacterium]
MYSFIASVLSLDICPEKRTAIAGTLKSHDFNWNKMVKSGSDNLVLPAFYLKLCQHSLNQFLPSDLESYLQHVLTLNRERNSNVITLAKKVNSWLAEDGIDCLFMKGAGNILDGIYSDLGERLLYDIDILVAADHMLPAANILHERGFITRKRFNPASLESTMHYPILLHEEWMTGVEIHRMPVQYHYQKEFPAERVFANKTHTRQHKGFDVMGYPDRAIHNFIHAQLMHSGHYHADVKLRDLYDLLLLGKRVDLYGTFHRYHHYRSKSMAYLKLMHKVFGLQWPVELQSEKAGKHLLQRQQRTLEMSSSRLRRHRLFITFAQKYFILPLRVLWNPYARNYVLSRLTQPRWYIEHYNAVKRMLRRGRAAKK